jgi:NADPH-dependent glutamate synthase beta subunit-like oxidoreductase
VQVVGRRLEPEDHRLRDFLTRTALPHDFYEAGSPRHRPKDWPLDRDPLALETSIPGLFAAGDVRHGSTKRVAGAVGEGAMAITLAYRRLEELHREA